MSMSIQVPDVEPTRPLPQFTVLLIVIGLLLAVCIVMYTISAIRGRRGGLPPQERNGTGMLGGFINVGRPGGGVGASNNPGAFMLYGKDELHDAPKEGREPDPRKR